MLQACIRKNSYYILHVRFFFGCLTVRSVKGLDQNIILMVFFVNKSAQNNIYKNYFVIIKIFYKTKFVNTIALKKQFYIVYFILL